MRDYGVGFVIGLILTATLAPLLVVVVEAGLGSLELERLAARASQYLQLAQAALRLWRLGT